MNFAKTEISTLTATPGFKKYEWSTGQATASIFVNTAGNFAVTATDANGCTATATVFVTVFANPFTTLETNEIFCSGNNITINATGGNWNNYQWSDGSNLETLTVSQTGNYSLTITNVNGCTATADIDILAVPPAAVHDCRQPVFL